MAEAIIYTIFAIFAVYGMYTAAREVVLFITRLSGKKESTDHLCHGCKGCPLGGSAEDEDETDGSVPDCAPEESEDACDDDGDNDFFRT